MPCQPAPSTRPASPLPPPRPPCSPYSMRGKDVMRRAVGGAVEVHAVELDQLDEGHDPGMADIQDELRALTVRGAGAAAAAKRFARSAHGVARPCTHAYALCLSITLLQGACAAPPCPCPLLPYLQGACTPTLRPAHTLCRCSTTLPAGCPHRASRLCGRPVHRRRRRCGRQGAVGRAGGAAAGQRDHPGVAPLASRPGITSSAAHDPPPPETAGIPCATNPSVSTHATRAHTFPNFAQRTAGQPPLGSGEPARPRQLAPLHTAPGSRPTLIFDFE